MNFQITKYNKKYFNQSVELMSDTWNFNKLFVGLKKKNMMNELYFKFSLLDANYNQVIIDEDNNVCGFIFGKIDKKPHSKLKIMLNSFLPILKVLFNLVIGNLGNRKKAINIFKQFINIEKDLTANKNKNDAYVNLFFVGSSLRGLGYGKKLMSNYTNAAKRLDCNRLYLYTDKGCNYGYYDHNGFKRIIEISSPVLEGYGEEPNGFAYIKQI